MGRLELRKILVTPLKIISVESGDVMHALKSSDLGFIGFGEAYFSWIEPGVIKAWKCHLEMTLNLVVPVGEVQFVFFDSTNSNYYEETIGKSKYARITVPPGFWFGFQGQDMLPSLVMNIADKEHNQDEELRKPISSIAYNWGNY